MEEIREVPLRPENDVWALKDREKDALVFSVLFRCENQTAFMRFFPEYLLSDGKRLNEAGKRQCRELFGYARSREFLDAYRATLAKWGKVSEGIGDGELGDGVDGKRKERALRRLLGRAMRLVEGGEELDADTLKVVTDIFTKLGFIKDEGRVEEPRRYLPESCGACRYKALVEDMVASGEIEAEEGDG